jgi:hypothetical protein
VTESRPYLSLVATSRNDDHGGRLLHRMQIFVDGFIEQCQRHRLDAELILVEWNPPPDWPRLTAALRWPSEPGPCRIRIIEVPPEVHRRFQFFDCLPLFQMIAKNVGIRRARGQFVLATNVDILFSDELMRFLASRRLDGGRMYRIDRHDVMSDVPLEASLDEQLSFCRSHLLRVHTRDGSCPLEPDGHRALETVDIAAPDSGLRFGPGWFTVADRVVPYRWASPRSQLIVTPSDQSSSVLMMDVEASRRGGTVRLRVRDATGRSVAKGVVTDRELVYIKLPAARGRSQVYSIEADGEGVQFAGDAPGRIAAFRVYRCGWASSLTEYERAGYGEGCANFRTGIRGSRRPPLCRSFRPAPPADGSCTHLHTNACGDFTLMARQKWFDLRGYPEFELFSFHLDSVSCYAAHNGGARELVLEEPMRIYHIEHEVGSGWTPEGHEKLFQRLAALRLESLDYATVVEWARQMVRFRRPMIFNGEDWGLADLALPEVPGGIHGRPDAEASWAETRQSGTAPAGSG